MGTLRTWGSMPLFSLHMSPIPRAFWVSQGFLSSPSDTALSLTGFVHQEEEEVIPQLPSKAPTYGQWWAMLGRGHGLERRKSPTTTSAPLPGHRVRASSQGGLRAFTLRTGRQRFWTIRYNPGIGGGKQGGESGDYLYSTSWLLLPCSPGLQGKS